MDKKTLRTALLGSGAAVAMLAASGPALAGEDVDGLKSQIEALQNRLEQLEKQDGQREVRRIAPAQAVTGGDFPGSFKLPGSDTSYAIHGYAKVDAIYDLDSFLGDSAGLSGIPPDDTTADNRAPNFRMHAKQSRFNIQSRTPTEFGQLKTYIEGDFEGTGGNQFISNSNSFRLRHAYGQLGPVLGGQTWSTFMDVSALPETIDFGGPAGESFVRQAQIRWTHSFGNLAVSAAIENPETDTRDDNRSTPSNLFAIDNLPDFIGQVRWNDSWGHLQASAVIREISVDDGGATNGSPGCGVAGIGPVGCDVSAMQLEDDSLGWGVHFSGTVQTWGKDSAGFEVNFGEGIGRYILNAAGSAADVDNALGVTTPGNPNVQTVGAWGALIWYQHWWQDNLRSTVVFGHSEVDNDCDVLNNAAAQGAGVLGATQNVCGPLTEEIDSFHANLIWSPVPQVNIGVEFIWGHREIQGCATTSASPSPITCPGDGSIRRIQLGMQYKF